MDPSIRPYKINVPDSAIEKLHAKLDDAKFPSEIPLTDSWDYGVPVSHIKRLVNHWRNGFDWRAAEAKLNEIPQYTTTISVDGFGDLDIHFVWQKSTQPGAVPLLFCHGCEYRLLDLRWVVGLTYAQGQEASMRPLSSFPSSQLRRAVSHSTSSRLHFPTSAFLRGQISPDFACLNTPR